MTEMVEPFELVLSVVMPSRLISSLCIDECDPLQRISISCLLSISWFGACPVNLYRGGLFYSGSFCLRPLECRCLPDYSNLLRVLKPKTREVEPHAEQGLCLGVNG